MGQRVLRPKPTFFLATEGSFHVAERPEAAYHRIVGTFILWIVLFIICWPLALLALFLYPVIWLLLLPFRLLGIAVEAVFNLLKAILTLPARLLGGPKRP